MSKGYSGHLCMYVLQCGLSLDTAFVPPTPLLSDTGHSVKKVE